MYIVEATGTHEHATSEQIRNLVKLHKLGTIKGMYLSAGNGQYITAEKEYARISCAIKMATRIANAGYVIIDNPELWFHQRYFPVTSVRVYNEKNPDVDIDF